MSDSRLGQKHSCFGCSAKFYDLNREEVVCPRCGENQSKAPRGADMSAIAAKVLASSVTEADEPGEGYGPVADEMELFDSDGMPGEAQSSTPAGSGTSSAGSGAEESEPEFEDEEF